MNKNYFPPSDTLGTMNGISPLLLNAGLVSLRYLNPVDPRMLVANNTQELNKSSFKGEISYNE